jgi:hypothetical protein
MDMTEQPIPRAGQDALTRTRAGRAAAEHGLWYPPDPSSFEICSIGRDPSRARSTRSGSCTQALESSADLCAHRRQ